MLHTLIPLFANVEGAADYWILEIGDGVDDIMQGRSGSAAFRSNGNLVVVGTTTKGVSTSSGLIVEVNSAGDIIAEKDYSQGSSTTTFIDACAIDSSDNLYIVARAIVSSINRTVVAKFNSSYTRQWEFRHQYSSSTQAIFDCDLSADGASLYVSSRVSNGPVGTSVNNKVLARITTSTGAIAFDTAFADSTNGSAPGAVAVTSDDRVFLVGHRGDNLIEGNISEWDDGLSLQAQRKFTGSARVNINDVAVSDDGNTLFFCGEFELTDDVAWIGAYDITTALTFSWDRQLSDSGKNLVLSAIAYADGNVYAIGNFTDPSSTNLECGLVKYSAAGTLDWKLRIKKGTDGINVATVVHDGSGSIYAVFRVDTSGDYLVIAKLPDDGSITGTFGSWTIADDTAVTDAAITATEGAGSLTAAAISQSETASTITVADIVHGSSLEEVSA